MSKQNGVKNEMGREENPSQTRASTTLSKEDAALSKMERKERNKEY
ncbi:hypothetical protein [Brevibacillus dissolubilis]|nr:hypothetical protein [Brevibacillus dissolubilis]